MLYEHLWIRVQIKSIDTQNILEQKKHEVIYTF